MAPSRGVLSLRAQSCGFLLGLASGVGSAAENDGEGGASSSAAGPDEAAEHFHRGNRLLRSGDSRGAELAYRRAAELRPSDPAFFVNLCSALLQQQGRQEEAVAAARSAVAASPGFARAHLSLGQALAQAGRGHQRDALRRFSRASALDPADPDVAAGFGREMQRQGNYEGAVGLLEVAVRARPGEAAPQEQLGYTLSKLERLSEAHRWLAQAAERRPTYAAAAKLIEVLLWLGDETEARRVAEKAVGPWGLWRNPMQRPTTFYRPELLAKPWWSPDDSPSLASVAGFLASAELVRDLRDELASVSRRRPGGWRHQPERIQEPGTGRWKEWKVKDDRSHPCRQGIFPKTCSVLTGLGAWVDVQWAEFSVLEPGAHIRPHTGPTNDRISLHLCTSAPPGVLIRIGEADAVEYRTGSVLFFDDSFEHEVWHRGEYDRVVLLVQFTHLGLLATPQDALGGSIDGLRRTDL